MAKVIRNELYKIFIKEKFIIVIVLYFIIKIAGFCSDQYAFPWKSKSETVFYTDYMKTIEGELTPEKAAKIEADIKDEDLLKEHYSAMGTISLNYKDIQNNVEKKWLMEPNALELWFANSGIDWLFIFVIIFMVSILVSKDYAAGILQTTSTTKYGGTYYICSKVIIMISFIAAMGIFISLIQLGIYGIHYPVKYFGAPVQSYMEFSNYSKDITFLNAFIIISIARISAYIIFGMIFFGIASIIKNSLTMCAVCTLIIFIPFYFFNDVINPIEIYKLPLPIGALCGLGYFIGDTVREDIIYKELSMKQIVTVSTVQFVIGMCFLLVGIVKMRGRKIKLPKVKLIMPCILVLLMLTTGCGSEKLSKDNSMYGRNNVTDTYVKISDYELYDIDTEEKIDIRQSIYDDRQILAIGDKYVLIKHKEIEGSDNTDFTISLYNPKNSEEHLLLKFGNNIDNDAFLGFDSVLGINTLSSDEAVSNMGINTSVVYENNKLYYVYNEVVVRADCKNNNFEIIYYDSVIYDPIISDNKIIYIDGKKNMQLHSFLSNDTVLLEENVECIWLVKDKILYSKADEEKLYIMSIDGNNKELLMDNVEPVQVNSDDTYICILDSKRKVYVIEENGFKYIGEYDIEDNENLMGPDKGNLYFTTFNENGIDVRKISIT